MKELWKETNNDQLDDNNRIVMKVKADSERPSYANRHAAGLDIRANNEEPIAIEPGGYADIPTHLSVQLPKGHFGMIVPRSGLGFKHRITLINDVGIIDEDYRGNIGLRMVNDGDKPYIVNRAERVAQMIVTPYIQPVLVFVDELDETDRGSNGFGSTGR
jgi:dUTP pyrophosphatase